MVLNKAISVRILDVVTRIHGYKRECGVIVRASTVNLRFGICIRQRRNLSLPPPMTYQERPRYLNLCNSLRDLFPNLHKPITGTYGWEYIDHPVCHRFEIGFIEGERHLIGV